MRVKPGARSTCFSRQAFLLHNAPVPQMCSSSEMQTLEFGWLLNFTASARLRLLHGDSV